MSATLEYIARANARALREILAELVAVPGERVGYELADALNELLPTILAAGEASAAMRADMIATARDWLSRVDPQDSQEGST